MPVVSEPKVKEIERRFTPSEHENIEAYVPTKKQIPLKGFELWFTHFKHNIYNLLTISSAYKNPYIIFKLYREINRMRNKISDHPGRNKLVRVNNKIYIRLGIPGWESDLFKEFILSETNKILPLDRSTNRLVSAFVAITKKCPLKCEHCFEWDNLNKQEVVTEQNLEEIIHNLQKVGTSNILLSGGEPTLRSKEILPLINKYQKKSSFWLLTSGFHFTSDVALEYKNAGLTGVIISLDHFDEKAHNAFRGDEQAYQNALNATKYAVENEFVTAFSVCFTRTTANESFIRSYMEIARKMGVAFVQFLEPKPVGHYSGQDVLLSQEQIELLDSEFIKYNSGKDFQDYPIIIYHGNYQRKMGCLSGGSRAIYIDTNGNMVSCPFCQNNFGSAFGDDFEENLVKLSSVGCNTYELFQM